MHILIILKSKNISLTIKNSLSSQAKGSEEAKCGGTHHNFSSEVGGLQESLVGSSASRLQIEILPQ